jgi:hypothetical protein
MAKLKRTEKQFAANSPNDIANVTGQSALRDWIEGCRVLASNAAGPRLVPRSTDSVQGPWIPAAAPYTADRGASGKVGAATPLLPDSAIGELLSRWNNIQAEFVDEPRRAVEEANRLVANAVQLVAEGFANERASLERQWESGGNVSTEELRLALKRYRVFFSRILNAG